MDEDTKHQPPLLTKRWRNLYVPDPSRPRKDMEVPFDAVAVGERFWLRPVEFLGITFVKTGPDMAELATEDDYAPKQSFDPATRVHVFRRELRPARKKAV